jgi:hypothetical protein
VFISKKRKKDIIKSELISGTFSPAPERSKKHRAPNTIWSNADIQSLLNQLKNAKA